MQPEQGEMSLDEKVELTSQTIERGVREYSNLFVACSFGKDSRVLVDLAMKIKPDIPFVGIDTGYEFPETLSFAEALVRETGMNFRWVRPPDEDRERIEATFGESWVRNDRYKCCEMKGPAIRPLLEQSDAWVTALRRDETPFRKDTQVVELGPIVKLNPLAFWTKHDIWQYIRLKELRYHPLYDAGFDSLGCEPCTGKPVASDRSERSGRFFGTSNQGQECGLHLNFEGSVL